MKPLRFLVLVFLSLCATGLEAHLPTGASPSGPLATLTPARYAQQDDVGSPRAASPLTILQINDVYATAPVGDRGGLARVATLKRTLADAGRTPLLVIAGDFLSSSVESTVFKGEQMVAALNAAGLDMATLGNHEFDFGYDVLIRRMSEAKWQWVVSNVVDTGTGRPVGNAAPHIVRRFGALRVGFIGLCVIDEGVRRDKLERLRFINPIEAAEAQLAALKAQGVDVIVALTHLTFDLDRTLAEKFPEIDLIVGGHEHYPIAATVNRTLISKAGSDAKNVARIDIGRRAGGGPVERFYELIPITPATPDDQATAAVVASYASRLGDALKAAIGTTRAPLDGVSQRLRTSETNLGNLVADAVRANAASDIAIVNSGGIRGDRIYGAGPLLRRDLVEMHPFGNVICKLAVAGRVILDALEFGASRLPAAAGQFPQVSGLTMEIDRASAPGNRVRNVRVGGRGLDSSAMYTLAIPDYLLNGGDGYTMFGSQQVLIGPESGDSIATALEAYVAGRREVNPSIEGRITVVR